MEMGNLDDLCSKVGTSRKAVSTVFILLSTVYGFITAK